LFFASVSTNDVSTQTSGDKKEPLKFSDLSCEEIVKKNNIGLKYSKNDTSFSQERIIECLKEIENKSRPVTDEGWELSRGQEKNAMQELSCKELKEKYDGKIHTVQWGENKEYVIGLLQSCDRKPLESIQTELELLQNFSCGEIMDYVSSGQSNEFQSKDNRAFAREKVGDCNDKQELPYRDLHYSSILISAQTPQEFYTEYAYDHLLTAIYSNVVKENNFQLSDALLQHQIDFCKLYAEKFDAEINACDNIQITTQPYKPTKSIEELYDVIYQNELDIINNTECSELHDAYDGKMHTVGWLPHKDMISNALNNCKDAGWEPASKN